MSAPDASWQIQVAVVAALQADAALAALVGASIFNSRPDPNAALPWVSYGPSDSVPEVADEYEGHDETIQIDAFSDSPSEEQIKRIGAAIRAALHYRDLEIAENHRLVILTVEGVRYLTDPDGLTRHAAVSVRARTEPTV